MRRLLALIAFLSVAPAAQAEEVYKWSSETRSFSYAKSVCGRGDAAKIYTEEVTQEIFHRASGVSHAGDGRSLPRGSSMSHGRIRRALSKKVEDSDGTRHQDAVVTETLPLVPANWGAINRSGKGAKRTIDLPGEVDAARFAKLKKGQTITVRVAKTDAPAKEDDGHCVVEGHGSLSGFVTITRVR